MKRSIPFGKERDDFSLSINSIWWKSLFHLERRGNDFSLSINSIWWNVYSIWKGEGLQVFDEKVYSICKGEGWLFAINKQYLMKRSIPFGKERDDFSLSINSIWWNGLFHLDSLSFLMKRSRGMMTFRYQ